MKREVYEIDEKGYIQDIFIKSFNEQGECEEEIANNIVVEKPQNGLYRAKWTGEEWIEDMSKEEINALNNQPQTPTTDERLQALELMELERLLGGV